MTENQNNRLKWALQFAKQGFRIHLLPPNSKIPEAGSEWKKDATSDPATITAWFTESLGANYLVAPDEQHFVLDLDVKGQRNGIADLSNLEFRYGDLADTLIVRTPSGGLHIYYKGSAPASVAKKSLGGGIDIRGNFNGKASYVLGPGSIIDGNSYTTESDKPIAAAPEWLVKLCEQTVKEPLKRPEGVELDQPINVATMRRYLAQLVEQGDVAVQGQGGDDTTYKVFCTVLDYCSADTALQLVKEIYNPACVPPWDDAGLERKCNNAVSYRQNDIGAKAGKSAHDAFKDYKPKDDKPAHSEVTLVPFSQIEEERIEWLWQGRFAVGKLNLIAGTPGDGKTTIAIDLAARQSNGNDLPFMEGKLEQSLAVILSAEDDASDTLKPRLRAAGANMENVLHMASEVNRNTERGVERGVFNFVDDMRRVEEQIIALRKQGRIVKSFIIDPISSFMGGRGKGDMWKNADTRYILTYLTDFARRQKVAIIGITHLNKSADTRALYRVIDSIGMVGAARGVWITAKELDDNGNPTGRTIFALGKTNIAKPPSSLAYKIEGVALPAADGGAPIETSRIKWEAIVALTADQALARAGKGNSEESKTDKAAAFLEQALADGPLDVNEIKRKARKQKQSWRTIERAKAALGMKARRTGGVGTTGKWEWSLPDDTDDRDPDFALLYEEAPTEHQPMSAFGGKADMG